MRAKLLSLRRTLPLAAGVVQAEAVRGRVVGAVLHGQSPITNGERIGRPG